MKEDGSAYLHNIMKGKEDGPFVCIAMNQGWNRIIDSSLPKNWFNLLI